MANRVKRPKSKVRKILEWTGFGIIAALFIFAMAAQIDAMVHRKENWGQQLRFGTGSFVVETNSMEPEYRVGSAIITYRKNADDIYARYQANKEGKIDLTFSYQTFTSYVPVEHPELNNQTNEPGRSIPTNIYGKPITHRLREIKINPSVPLGQGRYFFVVSGINPESTWALNQYQVFSEEYLLGEVVLNSDALGQVFRFIASPWGLFGLLLIPAFYLVISSMIDIFRALKEPEEASAGGGGSVSVIADSDRQRLKQEMLMQMLEEKRKAKAAQKEPEKSAEIPENDAKEPQKEEKKEALSGFDDAQKQALRQQMLAQIMAERNQGKESEKPKQESKPEKEPKPAEKKPQEKKGSLDGYSDEEKARLRQQMLAEILAEKKAAKDKKKEGDDNGKA